jgi:hypothetical protein
MSVSNRYVLQTVFGLLDVGVIREDPVRTKGHTGGCIHFGMDTQAGDSILSGLNDCSRDALACLSVFQACQEAGNVARSYGKAAHAGPLAMRCSSNIQSRNDAIERFMQSV